MPNKNMNWTVKIQEIKIFKPRNQNGSLLQILPSKHGRIQEEGRGARGVNLT